MKKFSVYCLGMLLLAGCSSDQSKIVGENADLIYKEAEVLLSRGNYEDAAKKFKDIDAYFPYSEKASRSQVMEAYCHFRSVDIQVVVVLIELVCCLSWSSARKPTTAVV